MKMTSEGSAHGRFPRGAREATPSLSWWGCTLTMRSKWQLVATHGNGFSAFLRFLRPLDLRPIATGCNHGAP